MAEVDKRKLRVDFIAAQAEAPYVVNGGFRIRDMEAARIVERSRGGFTAAPGDPEGIAEGILRVRALPAGGKKSPPD